MTSNTNVSQPKPDTDTIHVNISQNSSKIFSHIVPPKDVIVINTQK